MNYNILTQDSSLSIKQQIFKNRDIPNYQNYDLASKKDIIHYSKLGENINVACNLIMKSKKEGNGVGIQVDSDP